jgi:hypothetical protein
MTDNGESENLEKIKKYTREIGDEILTDKTVPSGDGSEASMLICHHGGTPYTILEESHLSSYLIRYRFNLVEQIAGSLSDDQILEWISEESEIEGDIQAIGDAIEEINKPDLGEEQKGEFIVKQQGEDLPPAIEAAENIIESMDEDVLERFGLNLFQELSQPEVATKLIHTPNDYFNGFVIERRVFPEDTGFSLTEFNHSVQAVISLGTFGSNWFSQLMDTEIDDINESDIGKE